LLVNLGDTIQFSINKEHHLVLHGADTTMYNIGNYKNNPFYSKYRSPSIAMLDTMTISDYVFYCEGFSKKEQDHINLTFGLRKPALKKYLIQKSGFNLIKDLLNGYKKAGLTKDDSIAFTSRREVQWLHNPYTPYDESYRLALGSYVELLAGESNNDYSPTKFSKLLDVSTEVLAIDQQQYFRLSLLKRISTISQSEYDYVTRRIFKELSLSKLSVKERAKINALYHNALVMSKKIYDLPAIKMQKISGEFVELKSIMQPGKFLLIDFWASWCGPCIAEIPFLNKLSTTYAQLQVVSISIDEDKQNWLKATAKYKVNEDQNFLIPNVKQSKFLQNFQIKEIPRFLLFDRDGKCITASAPSPSDSHFDGYLQNILQKQ
jgi:thiol-disulfide isomerase/thioredoxin